MQNDASCEDWAIYPPLNSQRKYSSHARNWASKNIETIANPKFAYLQEYSGQSVKRSHIKKYRFPS